MLKRIKQFTNSPTGSALAKGGSIILFFKVVGALGGYVLLYSLGSVGGELAVGIYEVAFTVVVIGSALSRWGLDTVLVRELARDQHAGLASRVLYLSVLKRVIILSIGWAIVVFLAASLLTKLFFQDTPPHVLTTAALTIIPFTLMLLNAEVFRAMGKSLLFSLNQHGTVYVLIGVLIAFVPFPEEYTAAAAAQTSLFLLLGISGVFFLWSTVYILTKMRGEQASSLGWKGQLFSLGTPMLISSSLFLVISWSDTLMLGYYLPEGEVGIYRIVFKIVTLITFSQFALNTVVAPMVSALSKDRERLHEMTHKVAQLNLLTAGPIFLIVLFFGPFLIQIFGVDNPHAAYPWLALLAIGQLTNAFAGPVMNILNMTGYEKSARNTMMVIVVLNILLNYLLIPPCGPLGAAIATTLTMIGWNVWAAALVYKFHGVIAVPFLTHIRRDA
jgi:O-antigen/teichoic acid export membrane protein